MELFLLSLLSVAIISLLITLYIKKHNALKEKENDYNQIYNQYKDVVDLDRLIKDRENNIDKLNQDITELETEFKVKTTELNLDYKNKRSVYDQLMHEIELLEENLEMTSYGLYQPHYEFDTSEEYKQVLDGIRKSQKEMVKNKTAVVSHTEWTVDGSKTKGRQQVNQYIRIMLRAFNGECDAAVAKVTWNNITRMEERIRRSYDAINKVGTNMRIEITDKYLNFKMNELHLTHEYEQKKYEEKEEQRRIREDMKEEERAQRELEKAQIEAEKEEQRYEKALDKARKDVEKATGDKLTKLNEQIAQLEQQLEAAHEQKERAVSRAQVTKSGYVYVISNIGSFGDDVYKIGLTRRLEPMDRVKELGDASVPFTFDVHAMIFSEDAPGLENTLHRSFNDKRVNLVNQRKEFFNVSLDDIARVVQENHSEIEFTKLAEAKEYRETLARLREDLEKETETKVSTFPDELE